mmetsp:Transcript_10950/g.23161  ORF Transcript_10950/g.23161 Transcript_10950/m.23161 type:complete len:214 (+) Transcript_10950:1613-2254(+)
MDNGCMKIHGNLAEISRSTPNPPQIEPGSTEVLEAAQPRHMLYVQPGDKIDWNRVGRPVGVQEGEQAGVERWVLGGVDGERLSVFDGCCFSSHNRTRRAPRLYAAVESAPSYSRHEMIHEIDRHNERTLGGYILAQLDVVHRDHNAILVAKGGVTASSGETMRPRRQRDAISLLLRSLRLPEVCPRNVMCRVIELVELCHKTAALPESEPYAE